MTQPDERLPDTVDVLRLRDGDLVVLRGASDATHDFARSLHELTGKRVGIVAMEEGMSISAISRESLMTWLEGQA